MPARQPCHKKLFRQIEVAGYLCSKGICKTVQCTFLGWFPTVPFCAAFAGWHVDGKATQNVAHDAMRKDATPADKTLILYLERDS